MEVINVTSIQTKLTTEELLNAMEQLSPKDAEKITRRLLHLQAQRKTSSLSKREAELLQIVYQEKRPGFEEPLICPQFFIPLENWVLQLHVRDEPGCGGERFRAAVLFCEKRAPFSHTL